MASAAYEYSDDESVYDDNDYSSVSSWEDDNEQVGYRVRWPATRMAYPSPAFIAKNSAPVFTSPKPADPAFVEKYTAVMEMLKGLNAKKEDIKAKQQAKSSEILKAEATPVTYANKWSDKAKGNGRDALIKRLSEEMAVLQKEYESVTGQIHKTEETNKAVINYIKAVEATKALYEKGKADDHAAWIRLYGPHTPIKSLDQLKRYYNVSVSPSAEAGMIRIHFLDDMEVGQAVRELKMGGHEYVWRVNWVDIEVMESGFKE
jgi:hypothetical protein